jgi:hypothetical protein
MASAPFAEVAVQLLKVREHRFRLAPNLLPEPASLQARRCRSDKLAAKTLTSMDRRAIALLVTASM